MDPVFEAFYDELEKVAASGKIPFSRALSRQLQKRVGKTARSGTRPQRATTLLERHKHGTLKAKLGEYNPTMGNAVVSPGTTQQELIAQKPRKKGDVPSREAMDTGPNKMDGRDNAATVYGPGSQLTNIGAMNYPAEHGL